MADSIHLTNLSWLPHRPCMLLKCSKTTILLDCALDAASMSYYMPFFYQTSDRLRNLRQLFPGAPGLSFIKSMRDNSSMRNFPLIEDIPEVHPMPLCSVDMSSVDAIVVSNWHSLMALPFFTEGSGFRGRVYATEPTLQMGRLVIEEVLEYYERVVVEHATDAWKDPAIYESFSNAPQRSPKEWRSMYNKEIMEKALERVRTLSFNETVTVDGEVKVTACGSGHAIGACNWLIQTDHEKVGYMASTASRATHTRKVDWTRLRQLDALIVTSLSNLATNNPEANATALIRSAVETVKSGGNVVMPVIPCGTTFDLIELIAKNIDAASDVPIYFVSPVGRKALAYANVYPEWLADGYLDRVYVPEEPFILSKLTDSKRVRVFDSLYGDFSRELRVPCVVFTGHPSLRIGDAPHLIEMWGQDPRNLVILTDPDYPPESVYSPFEDLPMKMRFYPIDCRLDFSQLNPYVLQDLKPKTLIVPEPYAQGQADAPSTCVEYNPLNEISYAEVILIDTNSRKRKIHIHPEVVKQIRLRAPNAGNDYGACPLRGVLSCYDNKLQLLPPVRGQVPTPSQYAGVLTPEALTKSLLKDGITAKQEKKPDGSVVFTFDKFDGAVVTVSQEGQRTNIRARKEHRRKISGIITASLVPV